MKYIIDSRYYDGACITSMRDDVHGDYYGETLEELRLRYNNPYLVAVSPRRVYHLEERYERALAQPFSEITEERYWDLLDCVPPKRQHRNWFFVGECHSGTLHALCFRLGNRYYTGLRSLSLSDDDICRQIKEFESHIDFRPTLIKKTSIEDIDGYKKECLLYYFEMDGAQHLIGGICAPYNNMQARIMRENLAKALFSLRRNNYSYATLLSNHQDIFEFFKWVRSNKYTLQAHGSLLNFNRKHNYVDFYGTLQEGFMPFQYRIYSQEVLRNVICQLSRVKRTCLWTRDTPRLLQSETALIIRTDGTISEAYPANGTDFTLEEMQSAVGGMVETVALDEDNLMLVNEEGKLLALPYNQQADMLFRYCHNITDDQIVGDVLICKINQMK